MAERNEYERMSARAKLAAEGSGIASHMEAHALVRELLGLRLLVDVQARAMSRRQHRKVGRWLQAPTDRAREVTP